MEMATRTGLGDKSSFDDVSGAKVVHDVEPEAVVLPGRHGGVDGGGAAAVDLAKARAAAVGLEEIALVVAVPCRPRPLQPHHLRTGA